MYRFESSMTDRIGFDEHVQAYAREAFAALAATGEPLTLTDEMLESHRESFLDGLAVDDMEEAIARFDDAFRRAWAEEMKDRLFTVAEAAEALELSEPRVRTFCQEGRIGRKVGRDWVITADEIEAMRDRPGPGRPRKRDFEVYEDGAGQLHFFVFADCGDIEYAMIYLDPQDLRRDLADLREYGTAEDWAGMDMWDCPSTPVTPEEHYDNIRRLGRRDCPLIADQDGVYLEHAGIAAKDALSGRNREQSR